MPHATGLTRPEVSDAQLVERIKRGERLAEELLYRRHGPALLDVAMRLLRRKSEAEDALQDAFVLALERIEQLRDGAAARAWLSQIVVNRARMQLRRRAMLRALGLDRGDDDVTLATQAAAQLGPEERAELARLDRWIETMPAEQRVAWTLRHIEGWALEDISDACHCSLATTKRRVAAAEEALARYGAGKPRGRP